jgi:hypothetical protein
MTHLHITNRIVTTRDSFRYPPHAYREILISGDRQGASKFLSGLASIWGSTNLSYHLDVDGIWIALDGGVPPGLYRGPQYAFYPNGRIIDLNGQ